MKSSIPFSQILQIQCALASLQLQCADLKEYDAGWLKDGKKVLRQGGKFASKGEESEANKQLLIDSTPFVPLPDSAAKYPRLIKKLNHLRELQSKIQEDLSKRKELDTSLKNLKNLQPAFLTLEESNKEEAQLLELSLRTSIAKLSEQIAKLDKQIAKEKKEENPLRNKVARKMTFATVDLVLDKVLETCGKLLWGALRTPGVVQKALAKGSESLTKKANEAKGKVGAIEEGVHDATESTKKKVEEYISETDKKYSEKNKQNKLEIAKRYEKTWQQEKKDWSTDKAMKAAEDLGSDVANHVMKSLAPESAIAAAKSDTPTNFADALEMLQDPNIDFDFLFYLLSKPDFRAAILQQVVN